MIAKQKHLIRNTVLLVLLLLFFGELLTRFLFYVKGYPVGKLTPVWMAFQPIDSLVEQQAFFTDGNGIYKMRTDYWKNQPDIRVNNEHFRGRDFIAAPPADSSASVLFIGDSFVWGFHATPMDSCFADLLDTDAQFTCFNAGIPGTDPAQYTAVAEKYLPELCPHVTVVAIYLGNDLMSEQRTIVPDEELWYQTNAGWLPATYKGRHFASARESYQYLTGKYAPKTFWEKLLLKSAVGTAILSLPLRIEEYNDWQIRKKGAITNQYLHQIRSACAAHQSQLLVFVIPAVQTDLTEAFFTDATAYVKQQYPALMSGLENQMFVLPVKKEYYYAPPDGHFNNRGHRAAAEYMREKITAAALP